MAPKDPKIELLKSIPLFSGLAGRELERIAQLMDEVDVPAGKVLMRQGEIGTEMFIVVSEAVAERRLRGYRPHSGVDSPRTAAASPHYWPVQGLE